MNRNFEKFLLRYDGKTRNFQIFFALKLIICEENLTIIRYLIDDLEIDIFSYIISREENWSVTGRRRFGISGEPFDPGKQRRVAAAKYQPRLSPGFC